MRSPNYPSIPLQQAIELASNIFKGDRVNVIDKDVAAKHMGYTSLNGRTLKLLGALSQYGLVDKVGKGKVRVSATAVSILHGIDESKKAQAMLSAASSPALFKRIQEEYDNPSDATITSFLMREGFTDAAVEPVLKSYKDTIAFLAARGVSESHGNEASKGADSDPDEQEQDDDMIEQQPAAQSNAGISPHPPTLKAAPLDFQFTTAGVALTGKTNSAKELRAFVEKINALAALLPEDTEGED
jgi:hypothetical protein